MNTGGEVARRIVGGYLSVADTAKYFNRSERTIRLWCLNGTLLAFNCYVMRKPRKRWAIMVPGETF